MKTGQKYFGMTLGQIGILAMLVLVACAIGILGTLMLNSAPNTQAQPSPTIYTVILICDDCAEIGMEINIWQNAGTSRGNVSFRVPHNTTVNVLNSKIADDERRWFRVEHNGNTGWIAEDFVRK